MEPTLTQIRIENLSILEEKNEKGDNPDKKVVDLMAIQREKHLQPFTYVLGMKSKNFRKQLAKAFNYWFGAKDEDMGKLFKLIDLLHNASLVVDDIEDGSELRRGLPAAHLIYGIPLSINAANYVYFEALKVVLELECLQCVEIFTEELLNMHHGQGMELYWRDWEIFAANDDPRKYIPTLEEYEGVIAKKTSGQFVLLSRVMRQRMNEKDKDVDLGCFSYMVGLYFQMRDDFMNLTSQEYTATKGFCEDISEGKLSFPVIYALNKPNFEGKNKLMKILKERTTLLARKQEALDILVGCGALQYTKARLAQLKDGIEKEICRLGGNSMLETLLRSLWVET